MLTDSHCHLASHKFPPEEVADLVAHARSDWRVGAPLPDDVGAGIVQVPPLTR